MAMLIAETEGGLVEGLPAGCQRISVFRGVPYAAPPVGKNRWREPQPVERWNGIRPAFRFGPIPYQPRSKKGSFYQKESDPIDWPMSEDCLYLNIWTPAESTEEKLPVAVYIFGGGMRQGYGHKQTFDGEAFARRGMVYVSINYRVNLFGYFAHPELTKESVHHVSGSYGTLDQVAAIQWVYRNIVNFGGDPERISLFGQSAGADCVRSMITTPLLRGMIRGAIMQSGGGLSYLHGGMKKDLDQGEAEGVNLFAFAGISSVEEARELPPNRLLDIFHQYFQANMGAMITFAPLVDGYLHPESPVDAIRLGHHMDIPYLVGSTSDEDYAYDLNPHPDYAGFCKNLLAIYGRRADVYLELAGIRDVPTLIRHNRHYIGNYMQAGSYAFCLNQERLHRKPAFQYWFSHIPPGFPEGEGGAFHSAEHPYINETLFRMDRPYRGEDFELSQRMCGYWTQFLKNGDPNGSDLPAWTPYTLQQPMAMEFGGGNGMREIPVSPFVQFLADCGLEGLP
ncbi:carboxylesterase/lipase family protein [Hominifimenecus sp. rT4P-3]|uniref:carboxylesterase/lipase family protein n=1 Tax=Hominifimenecus sp. rT4P-3 TaxID=3242979 RepID=UPI003DA3B9A2